MEGSRNPRHEKALAGIKRKPLKVESRASAANVVKTSRENYSLKKNWIVFVSLGTKIILIGSQRRRKCERLNGVHSFQWLKLQI